MSWLIRRFVYVAAAMAFALAFGTVGYIIIQDYPPLDAFYMAMITITTVGYLEVHPLSTASRLFTSALLAIGVTTLFAGIGVVTQSVIELEFGDVLNKRRNKRMIATLKDHFIVCGFGRFGRGASFPNALFGAMAIRRLVNAGAMILATVSMAAPSDDAVEAIRRAVSMRASFDEALRANRGDGELVLLTRFNHETEKDRFVFQKGFDPKVFRVARKAGIVRGALEALDVLPRNGRIFFPAKGNIAYRQDGWAGSVSFWMKTKPNTMLKTRFCDPVQVTQRGAANGAIWCDFNDAKPRDMRMGAFPAMSPGARPVAEDDPSAPIIRLKAPRFSAREWRHVALVWLGFDTGGNTARAAFYVDGKPVGELKGREIAMEWDLDQAGIYIAVGYIGLLDEFAVFNRALTAEEVTLLFQRPGLLANR